jgi:hypothetical protein
MSRTRKDEAPLLVDEPVIQGRYAELDHFTVSFESFPIGSDPSPLFRGLPDDRCQCPHWGVVISGELVVNYPDHEETYRAGDAYYLPPGHLPRPGDGLEVVEFSPTELLQQSMAVVGANMEAGVLPLVKTS